MSAEILDIKIDRKEGGLEGGEMPPLVPPLTVCHFFLNVWFTQCNIDVIKKTNVSCLASLNAPHLSDMCDIIWCVAVD